MKAQRNTGLTVVVALVAVVATIGAYFLLFKPALDDRAEAVEALSAQEDFNVTLEARVAALQAKYEKMPELKEQLEQVQTEFPPNEDPEEVRRLINQLAKQTGVTIVSDSLSTPELVVPSGSLAAAAADVGKESYAEGLVVDGLYATTMEIEATGTQAAVERFVAELQLGNHRYFFAKVSEISLLYGLDPQTLEAAAVVVETPLKMKVTFFTLLDETSQQPRSTDAAVAPADPAATASAEG